MAVDDKKVQEAARRALRDNGLSEKHAEALADLFKATHVLKEKKR